MANRPPNLLLIITDQQRWDALGCVSDWVETPHLDRLAGEGVRFRRAFTTSPVCIPTRRSLATGLYPHNTGLWANQGDACLDPATPTWMQALRRAGYRMSLFGKTHLHPHYGDLRDREDLMRAYGWDDIVEICGPRANARCASNMTDRWEGQGLWQVYQDDYAKRFAADGPVVWPTPLPLAEYYDVYVGQQAKAYLRDYQSEEPWCCTVSFGGPHEPWDTPEPYASRYDPRDMPPALPRSALERTVFPQRFSERTAGQGVTDPDLVARMRANYAGNVTLIDDQIGEILGVLEERGELDHTVIVFTSDHGEMNADFGLVYKSCFFDGSVRVPFLVRTPETAQSGGRVSENLVEWIDAGPTLADFAGATLAHRQFGVSLRPHLEDASVATRTTAISEQAHEAMICDGRWKLCLDQHARAYQLFDTQEDPNELANRVNDPACREEVDRLCLAYLERLMASQLSEGNYWD